MILFEHLLWKRFKQPAHVSAQAARRKYAVLLGPRISSSEHHAVLRSLIDADLHILSSGCNHSTLACAHMRTIVTKLSAG